MNPLTNTSRITIGIALVVPCIAALWLMADPGAMSTSSFALATALLLTAAALSLNSGRRLHASSTR